MLARVVALTLLWWIPAGAWAQTSTLPGFPPGVFQSRGALDPAASAGCSQATAFLVRTSGLSANYQTQYTTMICGLVTDGVFTKLDVFYVFATADTTTAKLNLIQNAFPATAPNGDPTFTAQAGYTNPSNKYLDSGFNASTATTPQYVQNSASMFNWNSASGPDNGHEMGLVSGAGNSLENRTGGDLISVAINAAAAFTVANTDASGLWTVNRTSSSNVDIYHNGASFSLGNSSTSAAVQNSNMTFFVGSAFNTTATLKAGGCGSQLTSGDISNLNTRLTTFFANIP